MENMKPIIIAGDSGVYFGWTPNGVHDLGADGRIVITNARHLRRYYVKGRVGDGSAADLARLGIESLDMSSQIVAGESVLVGVRRAFPVAGAAVESFQ